MTRSTIAVVIPVCDGADLLGACVASVRQQVDAVGGQLIVVDDGSTDDSATVAADAGAEVLRLEEGGGPYRARNVGWRATDADILVFTDMRCRAEDGWLEAIARATADPEVAVAAGVSLVREGATWTRRVMSRAQPMDSRHFQRDPFLPWAPAANIAVRREVLEALDGFVERRSGSDVDLCWRAQLETGGHVEVVPEALMEWVPRSTMRSCLGQWYRYGQYKPPLHRSFEGRRTLVPTPRFGPLGLVAHEVVGLARHVRRQGVRGLDVEVGLVSLRIADATGAWVAGRRLTHDENLRPATTDS